MALPALQWMAQVGVLCGVIVPESNTDLTQDVKTMLAKDQIPIKSISKTFFDQDLVNWLNDRHITHCWLMTFPWKIHEELLNSHLYKFYNFHFGLLPEMKGYDPIFESIRQQKKETGITVHEVTNEIDGGAILTIQKIPIHQHSTHGMLCSQMAMTNRQLAAQLVNAIEQNQLPQAVAQQKEHSQYFSKPGLQDVIIQWKTMNSDTIDALVRSCNPWNKGAYTLFKGWSFRILSVTKVDYSSGDCSPGKVIKTEDNSCLVHCIDGNVLKINIIFTEEGFLDGNNLFNFGLKMDDYLN